MPDIQGGKVHSKEGQRIDPMRVMIVSGEHCTDEDEGEESCEDVGEMLHAHTRTQILHLPAPQTVAWRSAV